MKKIIVLCPGSVKTGGPEALHQLVHAVRINSPCEAYICYYGDRNEKIIKHYKSLYKVDEIELTGIKGNVLVFPEIVDPRYAVSLGADHNWAWWLSVNREYPAKYYIGIGNLCQSEYAASIIRLLKGKPLLLTDYLSSFHHQESHKKISKKDIIVYGPKSVFVALLLQIHDPRLPLKPVIGKNKNQTTELFSRAKIYIDFGWHQGRDRMPREAALYDCIVVTNRLGAANNDIDCPIKEEYKLDMNNIAGVTSCLRKYLKEYETRVLDFIPYKDWIKSQEQQFFEEVKIFAQQAENHDLYSFGEVNKEIDEYILLKQKESFFHRQITKLLFNSIIRNVLLLVAIAFNLLNNVIIKRLKR